MDHVGRDGRLSKEFLPILERCSVDKSVAAHRDRRKGGDSREM